MINLSCLKIINATTRPDHPDLYEVRRKWSRRWKSHQQTKGQPNSFGRRYQQIFVIAVYSHFQHQNVLNGKSARLTFIFCGRKSARRRSPLGICAPKPNSANYTNNGHPGVMAASESGQNDALLAVHQLRKAVTRHKVPTLRDEGLGSERMILPVVQAHIDEHNVPLKPCRWKANALNTRRHDARLKFKELTGIYGAVSMVYPIRAEPYQSCKFLDVRRKPFKQVLHGWSGARKTHKTTPTTLLVTVGMNP
jgi:hypothetical protein